MTNIPKPPELLSTIQQFEVFQGIPESALQWLIDRSDYLYYSEDDYIFKPEQDVNSMQVIIQGSYSIQMVQGGDMRELGVWEAGYVTGVLPFSRMKKARAFGKVIKPVYLLDLHKDHFIEMVNVSYELTQALVGVMSTRIRDFTEMRYQNEKLMALGKLSAGLAHELNNPASAMVRNADELYQKIHSTPEKFKSVITMRINPEQTDAVNAILFSKIKNVQGIELSLMDREEQKDDLLDWLEDKDVDGAEDIADTFVDYGITLEELDEIHKTVQGESVGPIMHWIESTLSLEKIVSEIQESADRIAKLVSSVKSYSHMDRGSSMAKIDIHEGIINTVIMLKHKLKQKQIHLDKKFDRNLPKLKALPGELNQVWTNLIVNAIDAMESGGSLGIRTFLDRQFICVEISDTGSGISEENLIRIFDPFFTTKAMGEGTGMGLDIVKKIMNRHKADIRVESQPGKTVFSLCFPQN